MRNNLTVQQRIKRIAEQFKGCQYLFANWSQINEALDRIDKPTICYVLPPSGVFHPSHGATLFVDRPLTMIAFLAPTEFDFDGEENDGIVELMKSLAYQFIRAVNESGYFDFIDDVDIEYRVPYDTTDDNVTGVIVNLPIEETPQSFCRIPDTFGFKDEIHGCN